MTEAVKPFLNKIIQGETLRVLKTMPDECVDLVITSPPYYGLRRYGDYPEQIGLEPTFGEFLEKILAITAEIKRVLKPTGQFWLNFGDCFGTGSGAGSRNGTKQATNAGSNYYEDKGKNPPGEHKCLMMMPERIAIAMCDQQGWILRNRIAWAKQILDFKERRTKGSVMPTSVKDRFNESWEYLYFFTKSKRYYSDLDAVRLPPQTFENRPDGFTRSREFGYDSKFLDDYSPLAKQSGQRFNYRVRDAKRKSGQPQFKASEEEIQRQREKRYGDDAGNRARTIARLAQGVVESHPNGKNLPTVWLIGNEPHNFSHELGVDADHFAIFPQDLVEIPIKFGTPPQGIILDPFMGSGTTAIVAKKLGRNYIGIELNSEYVKIAEKRLEMECPPTLL